MFLIKRFNSERLTYLVPFGREIIYRMCSKREDQEATICIDNISVCSSSVSHETWYSFSSEYFRRFCVLMKKMLRGAEVYYSRFDVTSFPLHALPSSMQVFSRNRKQATYVLNREKHL